MSNKFIELNSKQIYIAACANRTENNISCKAKYLLYSRCKSPIIYDVAQKELIAQLNGHTDQVNGQRFVDDEVSTDSFHVISTSYDKTAIIWNINTNKKVDTKSLYTINSPDDNVFTSRSCMKQGNIFLTVTSTLEERIYLWKNDKLIQTIQVDYCCLDNDFFTIQVSDDLEFKFLFVSGTDNKLHVFQLFGEELHHLFDLTGFNDWIKDIDCIKLEGRDGEFLLATASQDYLIRVWHMRIIDHEKKATLIRTSSSKPLLHSIKYKQFRLISTLETVLSGHEGFVHSCCWFKKQPVPVLQLVSCSADKTIIIWQSSVATISCSENGDDQLNKYEQYPASDGIWKELCKVGETGETNLPLLGVCLSDDEKKIYAQSLKGAIHSWSLEKKEEAASISHYECTPRESITGHYDCITDLSWNKTGQYLLSVSLDKTCRLHTIASCDGKWHEFYRPQVHGYEINCVVSLDFTRFVTGAEEKIIRVFNATQFFYKNLNALAKIEAPKYLSIDKSTTPAHAQLPALGLSIRGAQSPYDLGIVPNDDKTRPDHNKTPVGPSSDWYEISNLVKQLANLDHLNSLPSEEILLQSTLWWEANKLFGHSNELHALASDSRGGFLASACKANRADLARIFVWETEKFRKIATIEHHTLTITRLKFSPDDQYLLSVSRDRTWCLCEKNHGAKLRNAYSKLLGTNKSDAIHERIVWDCCWTYDSKYFITVSRDKKAILWSIDDLKAQIGTKALEVSESSDQFENTKETQSIRGNCATLKLFDCSIQAVDSPSVELNNSNTKNSSRASYLFVFGFENGLLELYSVVIEPSNSCGTISWHCLGSFPNFHQLSIKRLAFQPASNLIDSSTTMNSTKQEHESVQKSEDVLMLASCGDDCMVKLTKFNLACRLEKSTTVCSN